MGLMKKLSLYIFLVLMWCNVGVAREPGYMIGPITNKCEETIDLLDTFPEKDPLISFEDSIEITITSFISALNLYHNEINGYFRNLNYDDRKYVVSYTINYCRKNPDNTLFDAALDYFKTLPKYKE